MEDNRWKEFEMRVEAYRYYLNIALQTNVFFYAITGVTLGFYLNQTPNEFLIYVLLLPILIAAILGGIFLYAAKLQERAADTIFAIMKELIVEKREIKEIPDLELLYILLRVFGWIFFIVGLALVGTPFLKAAPFQWGQFPKNLFIFAVLGCGVLGGVGKGIYWFACKHDREVRKKRRDEVEKIKNDRQRLDSNVK